MLTLPANSGLYSRRGIRRGRSARRAVRAKRKVLRYEKAESVLRLALAMQGSAEGVSLEEMRRIAGNNLSRRTAERLRDAVERVFPQVEVANPGDVPKRWRLPTGTLGSIAALSATEISALAAGATLLARENMTSRAAEAESAILKLKAVLKPSALRKLETDLEVLTEAEGLAMRPGPKPSIDPEIVMQLRDAILACSKVRIHYVYRGSGKRGFEIVQPYGFLYGHRNYLVAWSESELARDFRNYALSNIERVDVLNRSFARRRGFSLRTYAERSFGVYQEKPVSVVWRFSRKAARDAQEYLFHPTQKLEPQKDGSLIVRFRAGGLQEMAWHLAIWGREVKVIAPARLARLLRQVGS